MTLNYRFLGDGLASVDATHVRIRQIDPMSPAVLLPEGSEEKYLYLLMPIRNA
jgi:DNA polymerase III sliding clamp (beta) subunit (PCNA family)